MNDLNHFKRLSDLQEWADNYNQGDVDNIARSIRRFGFNTALRVWGTTVMAGNHTMKALKLIRDEGPDPELDQQFPPRNVFLKDDEWCVPYVDVSHLDPLEAKAFAIADNTWARRAVTDDALLTTYLQEIQARDERLLNLVGFDDPTMSDMVKRYATEHLPIEFPEYTEADAAHVKMTICPHCGHSFPA